MRGNLPEEAVLFMDSVARLEYALRRNGYARKDKKAALIDWQRFARELGERFLTDVRDSGNAAMLIAEPPRIYDRDVGMPDEAPPPIVNVRDLFIRGVCQVRNNIAHGEKFVEAATPRDHRLVREAKWVLEQAIARHAIADILAKQPAGT